MQKLLGYNRLIECLEYNKLTGIFKWRIQPNSRIEIGDNAGYLHKNGYRYIRVDGILYLAHLLAWFYVYGYFPENLVDHKNRNGDDNRIDNLREVSVICNARNSKNYISNSSGIKGVSFHKHANKWRAQIAVNNKSFGLGLYGDFDDAVCARLAAEQCLGWSGCDSSSPAFRYVRNMQI